MRAGVPLWALLIVTVLCACARNPVSGRPEVVLVSKQAEVGLGEEAAKEVAATIGLVPDEALQAYVQQIGARLAVESPRQDVEYHVAVVDIPEPNAFALPGGYVYVSRGLLATAIREDELAAVIGHEIGHVAGRHTVQQVTTATPFAIVLGLPGAIVGTVSRSLGSILEFPGKVTGGLVLARRGRNQEHEADRTGMQIAAAAGWDPHALGDILGRMERLSELARDGESTKTTYFDSHPTTAERVGNVDAFAAGLESADVPAIAAGRNAFLQRLNGLLLADNPTAGVFADQTFLHPELGFQIDLPADWQRQNHSTHVLAVKPESKGRTFAMLQISSKGEDPIEGARADGLHKRLLDQLVPSEIHGLPAVVLETEERGSLYHVTWIAHRGSVYRISAVSDTSDLASSREILQRVAPTFRDLRPQDLERIRAHRLRTTAARPGETIATLYERSPSTWTPTEAALYNDVTTDAALEAGNLIKLSREEPYQLSR